MRVKLVDGFFPPPIHFQGLRETIYAPKTNSTKSNFFPQLNSCAVQQIAKCANECELCSVFLFRLLACSLTLTLFLIYCNYCCAKTGRSSSWVLFRDCNHGSNKAKLKRLNTCWPISLCGGALHFTGNFHKLHDDSTSSPNDFSLFLSFSPSVLAEEHTKSQMKYIKTDIERSIFVFDCPALSLKFYRSIFRCGCWLTTCRYFSTVWKWWIHFQQAYVVRLRFALLFFARLSVVYKLVKSISSSLCYSFTLFSSILRAALQYL